MNFQTLNNYDNGHQHHFAYSLLNSALVCESPNNTYEEAKACFRSAMAEYGQNYIKEFLRLPIIPMMNLKRKNAGHGQLKILVFKYPM